MSTVADKPPFWRSITWRIQIWYGLALALAITAMMVAFHGHERERRLDALDARLADLVRPILPQVAPHRRGRGGMGPPHADGSGPPPRRPRRPDGGRSPLVGRPLPKWIEESYWAVAWDPSGEPVYRAGREVPDFVSHEDGRIDVALRTRGGYRTLRFLGPGRRVIEVGVPTDRLEAGLRTYGWLLAARGLGLFAVGLLAGWLIVRWGLRPAREIGHTAAGIAKGDLSRRIDVKQAGGELHELAGVLNTAFARLERGIKERERFTADASHELRTPLAVVLGQIQQLRARPRSEQEYREGLATAEKAAQRMKTLVEELLVLARLDASAEPRREPMDLAEVVQSVTSEMRGLVAKRDATLDLRLEPAPLSGDRSALARVVTNLLGNALQHNPAGVRITIRTAAHDGMAEVTVADAGRGIAADDLEHLFDRFYRADTARTSQSAKGGSGLGLAICEAIVRQHGGRIDVESQPGEGSCFTVKLPASPR